jgi:hypothetical protein
MNVIHDRVWVGLELLVQETGRNPGCVSISQFLSAGATLYTCLLGIHSAPKLLVDNTVSLTS